MIGGGAAVQILQVTAVMGRDSGGCKEEGHSSDGRREGEVARKRVTAVMGGGKERLQGRGSQQ